MGGKHKQAQRTKNNARPSSSGRSAELLGNSAPTFVGFTAVKDGGFVPVLPGFSVTSEEFDPNLNPDFHLVLKKMGKKDSTTKLKALQEFSELIKNSESEAVKTVLPLWPRLYCHLAVDVEHRVREAAHQAQRAVVQRAKRNLAPYLRQLAGPWFTSQYDTYAPAASAASLAFQDAFPPKKVTEAIVFCQEEILNYIYDNLIVQTAQTLSNPKIVTAEEMEAKYQRVVVSSLQGYALYLHKIPAEQLQAVHPTNKKLISSKKFWKLAKHTSALIRNAWFSVLIALCQKAPDLLADEGARAALAVFGNLDETDSTVLPTVWEASLHVLTTVQDCWRNVSAEKLVLPKLWHILREGGQGNAVTIFPNLLPFLSKIPSSVCSNKQDFYDKCFDSIRHGLSQKSVVQSAAECNAVARCYVECLRYIAALHLSESDFCQALVQNHLIGAVELMLKDQKLQLVSAALFPQVSGLIYHWSNSEGYGVLVQLFWNNLTSLVLESLSSPGDGLQFRSICTEWLLNRLVELCLCLKNPKHQRSSRGLKVKFVFPENNSNDESMEPESPTDPVLSISNDVLIDKYLQTVVEVICVSCFRKTKHFCDRTFLFYLNKLIRAFESRELFVSLLKADVTQDIGTESKDSLVHLYDSTLHKWLQDEKICCENLVDITFSLLKFLTADEKNHVLDALCKVSSRSVFVWCVRSALEQQSDPCVQNWLRSTQLSQILVSLTHDICSSKTIVEASHILRCCLTETKGGELVISHAAFSDILSEFSCFLSSSRDELLCMDFVVELVMLLYSRDLMLYPFLHSNLAAENLLLSLFRLSCQKSKGSKEEVEAAWCVGISSLARLHGNCSEDFVKLTLKFAEVVKEELITREDVSVASVDHTVAIVMSFLDAAARCFPADNDQASGSSTVLKLCLIFLNCLSSKLAAREHKLTAICLYAENLKGLLNVNTKHLQTKYLLQENHQITGKSCIEDGEDEVGSVEEIIQYVMLLLFSITLISKLAENLNQADEDEIQDDSDQEDFKEKMSCSDVCLLEDHLLTAVYSVAVCECFIRHYKSSVYYYKVFSKYDILNERFKLLMRTFNAKEMKYITHIAAKRALHCGGLWLQALSLLHTLVLKQTDLHDLYLDVSSNAGSDSTETIHISEVYQPSLKAEDMRPDMVTVDKEKLVMVTSWLNQLEGTIPSDYVDCVLSFLNSVLIWYEQEDKTDLLFDCSVKWPQAKTVIVAARFLAAVVEKCPELLTSSQWDATVISLASWVLTVKNSCHLLLLPSQSGILPLVLKTAVAEVKQRSNVLDGTKQKLSAVTEPRDMADSNSEAEFAVAVFQLYKAVHDFLATSHDGYGGDVKKFHEKLKTEWTDVFANYVQEAVISLFYAVTGMVETDSPSLLDLPLLESLGDVMLRIDPDYFFPSGCTIDNSALDAMMQCCCELLHSSVIPLQLTAYHILTRLVPGLIMLDTPAAFAAAVDKDCDGLSLAKLQNSVQQMQTVVDTMLLGIRLGNSCTVCPFTDAYTYTMAYLLLWTVILEMCGLAIPELRYQYATILRNSGFLKNLLQNVFRLMPEQVLQGTDPKYKVHKTSEMFASAPSLAFSQAYSSEMLEHMSCWVYCTALQRLPALVRQWWSELEPRVASLVEQVTSVHCAPLLCAQEMKVIQGKDMHHGNMLVKVHPTVREVVAVYKVDEACMELSIQLPNNYPLGLVRVESGKQFVDSGQWRNWMMQLRVFLTHQNGSIWDGLALWKRNLDKRFEGVEECYICFSILHGSNFQIPRQCCSTCKKKFHSTCLYKWFNTSNKATCPICRNLF